MFFFMMMIMMMKMMLMMYTGAPRRAFQLPVAHAVEPKACTSASGYRYTAHA